MIILSNWTPLIGIGGAILATALFIGFLTWRFFTGGKGKGGIFKP